MRLFGVGWGSTHRLGTESTEHVCDVKKIPSIRKVEILSGKKKYFLLRVLMGITHAKFAKSSGDLLLLPIRG